MWWLWVILAFVLIFIYGTNQGKKIIKNKMLPALGPTLWRLLLLCKDEHFKQFVANTVEKTVVNLLTREQEMILQDEISKEGFLWGIIVRCYKDYINIYPNKKNEFVDLLDNMDRRIPDIMKQCLNVSDLPDGWATEHGW